MGSPMVCLHFTLVTLKINVKVTEILQVHVYMS